MFKFKTKLKKYRIQTILSTEIGPLSRDFGSWAFGKGWSVSSDMTKKDGRIVRVYIDDGYKEAAVFVYLRHGILG